MKDKRHIKSFNEHQENLNISDVSDSLVNFKKLKNIIEDSIENGEIDGLNYVFGSDWFEDLIKVFNEKKDVKCCSFHGDNDITKLSQHVKLIKC